MAYPVKVYPKNQGPQWLGRLQKYVENPKSDPYARLDNEALERNQGGDRTAIDDATYVEKGK